MRAAPEGVGAWANAAPVQITNPRIVAVTKDLDSDSSVNSVLPARFFSFSP